MRDDTLKLAEAEMAESGRFRDAVYRAVVNERKHTLSYKLCRLRQKIIWFGGWERANCGGWRFKLAADHWMDPFPTTLFGVLTFYGWGLQCHLPGTIFVWTWRGERQIYCSPDGTPRSATKWLSKKPRCM